MTSGAESKMELFTHLQYGNPKIKLDTSGSQTPSNGSRAPGSWPWRQSMGTTSPTMSNGPHPVGLTAIVNTTLTSTLTRSLLFAKTSLSLFTPTKRCGLMSHTSRMDQLILRASVPSWRFKSWCMSCSKTAATKSLTRVANTPPTLGRLSTTQLRASLIGWLLLMALLLLPYGLLPIGKMNSIWIRAQDSITKDQIGR